MEQSGSTTIQSRKDICNRLKKELQILKFKNSLNIFSTVSIFSTCIDQYNLQNDTVQIADKLTKLQSVSFVYYCCKNSIIKSE